MKHLLAVVLILVATASFAGNLSNTKWRVGNEYVGDFLSITTLGAGCQEMGRAVPTLFGVKDPIKRDMAGMLVTPLMMAVANQYPDDGRHTDYSFHYRLWKDGATAAAFKTGLNMFEHIFVRMSSPKHKHRTTLIARWSEVILVGGAVALAVNKEK